MNAETTLGNDDGALVLRFKNNPKAIPIKAIFGKKHIPHFVIHEMMGKFMYPTNDEVDCIEWEFNY